MPSVDRASSSLPGINMQIRRLLMTAVFAVTVFSMHLGCAQSPAPEAVTQIPAENLALNKPATCSSIESDEHNAAAANDGNPGTCWRADDEPEGVPDWWQVDLQKPADLSGCEIRWPFDGMDYQYKVEGSADGKAWSMLSDQTRSTARLQVHDLSFSNARGIRFVKITVTGFDDGCWASISELKIFRKGS